jgi:hypothetical protein
MDLNAFGIDILYFPCMLSVTNWVGARSIRQLRYAGALREWGLPVQSPCHSAVKAKYSFKLFSSSGTCQG